jgi:uncharacterized membrane protein YqaE (UPF0057 family)
MKVVAILCPPLAALACGGLVRFFISIPLTMMLWYPGWVYARGLVRKAELRDKSEFAAIMRSANKLK